jgi:hypothetical protein
MTIKDLGIATNTIKVARLLAKRMPHLEFAVWDLSDFMGTFHDVRRTMIFIECEEIARSEAIRSLADPSLPDYVVYSGERKPKAINEEWANARSIKEIRSVIVVIARKDFNETKVIEENIRFPSLERRLVDLVAYSLRGWLPISVKEAVSSLEHYLKRNELRLTVLQRYATRRYLGWFLDIVLYKLKEKGHSFETNLDPRYLELGKRYDEALQVVDDI